MKKPSPGAGEFAPARKSLGQNFLHQSSVIDSILQAFSPGKNDVVVEIGPGRGALTLPMLDQVGRLHVVEKDNALAQYWEAESVKRSNLVVHHVDALEFDIASHLETGEKARVIGNLPYNISSPLLFNLLQQAETIIDMHLMFQAEVAQRLVAQPGTKQYGRLSVMVQQRCDVSIILRVAPGAFTPAPRVDSAVVRLNPRLEPAVKPGEESDFASLVRTAFSVRRKTLRNSLRGMLDESVIVDAGIRPQARAEELSVDDFVSLMRSYRSHKNV